VLRWWVEKGLRAQCVVFGDDGEDDVSRVWFFGGEAIRGVGFEGRLFGSRRWSLELCFLFAIGWLVVLWGCGS
jgi:hypothetical protein